MTMTRMIRGTIYQVTIHIHDDGISMEDSILRMIANRPLPFLREPLAPTAALEKAIV